MRVRRRLLSASFVAVWVAAGVWSQSVVLAPAQAREDHTRRLRIEAAWVTRAVIIFLVWLWITNLSVLFGAELNAEIERGRQIEAGHPPEREPFLPPRNERR